jgi:hypothetical protein
MTGTVENHDEWGAFLSGELGDAESFGRSARPDRASEHTEIFGTGENGSAVDLATSADETFRRDIRDRSDQLPEFAKRIRIEERGQTLAGIELPAIVHVFLDPSGTTHLGHAFSSTLQLCLNRHPRSPILSGCVLTPFLALAFLVASRGPVVQVDLS